MAGEGRPTLCNAQVTKIVAEGLSKGLGVRASVARAAISKVTHYEWLDRGRAGEEPFANYLNVCEKAHSDFVDSKLTQIDAAADSNWQAAAWRLERGDPEEFGRREKTDLHLSGKVDTGPETSSLTDDEFKQYIELQAQLAELTRGAAKRDTG